MIDFIEYVVLELKSKRLSKVNALDLIRQFSHRSTNQNNSGEIHPLLHVNTSDISQQSFSTTFNGNEFFLEDHKVKGQKMLPGVAYLEMAQAATRKAMPFIKGKAIELNNVIWAQPIIVNEAKEVTIALFADKDELDREQIQYEVYSSEISKKGDVKEVIHCQGEAVWIDNQLPVKVDIEHLKSKTNKGKLAPKEVYNTYSKLGLDYGSNFQGIKTIYQGNEEVLAQLDLSQVAGKEFNDYQLHPGILDSALQAAIGLYGKLDVIPEQTSIPFAMESLRIYSNCTKEMYAWVRYAEENNSTDKIIKLDIDLCDQNGNVAIQMRGFSSRLIREDFDSNKASVTKNGVLLAAPVWQETVDVNTINTFNTNTPDQRYIFLFEIPGIKKGQIEMLLPNSEVIYFQENNQKNIAERFSAYAQVCFEQIRKILTNQSKNKTHIQIVIPGNLEGSVLLGLSSLLKTTTLENPGLTGQCIISHSSISEKELAVLLQQNRNRIQDTCIKYEKGIRKVLGWEEISIKHNKQRITFKDNGVYVITGGLGNLGVLLINEILKQTFNAKIIVTGRSGITPEKQTIIDDIEARSGQLVYHQLDITNLIKVKEIITSIKEEHKNLNGIIHTAGVVSDNFILKKTTEEFTNVLTPKVLGTYNLDEASKDMDLDFFVLFSSISSVTGNIGQSDYTVANGFMDQFALYRNRLGQEKRRYGKTIAVNWPLWAEGGMKIDSAKLKLLQENTGMKPMHTKNGMHGFYSSLELPQNQLLIVEGDLVKLRKSLLIKNIENTIAPIDVTPKIEAPEIKVNGSNLVEKTQEYIKKQLSELFKLPSHKIDPRAPFEKYGIDSILAMELTNKLEITFGSLPKTLFFEYQTIKELTGYFVKSHSTKLTQLFGAENSKNGQKKSNQSTKVYENDISVKPIRSKMIERKRFAKTLSNDNNKIENDPIAIIGLSGRYPEAEDIAAYWDILRNGKDCITEVPKDRWDWREFYNEDRSKGGYHYSKWGGFIEGVDEFDPLFFNISPLEAEILDPQERLFLQHAWMAMEDAGYTRATLQIPDKFGQAGQIGVYAGVMYSEYQLYGIEASNNGQRIGVPGSYASIANRVSYALNLHGPSMTVDSMCSSSLTAIHLACQDLKLGRTSMGIAGGVNISIHPNKYLVISSGQYISSDGHCQSFGEGGEGYIPGEGVGVVILKRLSDAERDGDHIYGIITGSALNHGGKTNGYSVPNPKAQSDVIANVLKETNTHPKQVSYIEAHGTGTKLGDPIEIAALSKAFQEKTSETGFCLIGSAKSNIGHCESAAGIAGLTKVLLQLKHKKIVPSLHSKKLNPNIDFQHTPFIVNQTLKDWEQPIIDNKQQPRLAGISSFGAGGANAHMLIQEYVPVGSSVTPEVDLKAIIPLSARTKDQLKQKALDLVKFLEDVNEEEKKENKPVELTQIAYTLQVGRENMGMRLGFMVSSIEELLEKLQAYIEGKEDIENCYHNAEDKDTLSLFSADEDFEHTVDKWIIQKKYAKLLDLWTKGWNLDWSKFYTETRPNKISLPVYPFAKDRYWLDYKKDGKSTLKNSSTSVLHPLLHSNTSDLSRQRYSSTFSGEEFFLADHRIKINKDLTNKVLPAVAYLEMVRAAVEKAVPFKAETGIWEFRNTAWTQALIVTEDRQVDVELVVKGDNQVQYEVYSIDNEQEINHCLGIASYIEYPLPQKIDIKQLKEQMGKDNLEAENLYAKLTSMGFVYGQSYKGVTKIHRGERQLLAQLQFPSVLKEDKNDYLLHPSILDSALQAAIGLIDDLDNLALQPSIPFSLDSIRIITGSTEEMFAWIRYSKGIEPDSPITKLDIDWYDQEGNVCIEMRGLSSRQLSVNTIEKTNKDVKTLLAEPTWEAYEKTRISDTNQVEEVIQKHIILCEIPGVEVDQVETVLANTHCKKLKTSQKNVAERYNEFALQCFEFVKDVIKENSGEKKLIQIVITNDEEHKLFSGLQGILKTATQENPMILGQIVLTKPGIQTEELIDQLQKAATIPEESCIRYENNIPFTLQWKEIESTRDISTPVFKDQGVYLITGGLGALGRIFAEEILEETKGVKIIVTGRSELTKEKQEIINKLSDGTDQVIYKKLDVSNSDEVKALLNTIIKENKQLNGIIHSAGMIADNYILKKTKAEFNKVLIPKVTGTYNLDQASKDIKLDFMVLFSSLSAAMGNLGQADYATANAFMDQYADYRNHLVDQNLRRGFTLSINWPLWQEGHLTIDQDNIDMLQQLTGIVPMQTKSGIDAFYRSMTLKSSQVLVVEGEINKMRTIVLDGVKEAEYESKLTPDEINEEVTTALLVDQNILLDKTIEYLRKQFAGVLKLPVHKLNPKAALENYGIDSILAMKLTSMLEETFGSLSKTLFFEYQTIKSLGAFFAKTYPEIIQKQLGAKQAVNSSIKLPTVTLKNDKQQVSPLRIDNRFVPKEKYKEKEVAIVGLGGKYPLSENVEAFWENLKNGKDCITEIPNERWNLDQFFDPQRNQPGKSYSKWGGFISDVDKFDPLFFNISPREAELMDPQERLFIETAWQAIEDAGYSKQGISSLGKVGVYVGVMYGQYQLYGAEAMLAGNSVVPGSSYASIANRVSYFLDLHGPSIALDTMCSSSLTAIHQACEEIRKGEIVAAIAGGVNVSIHPHKYLILSQGNFAASEGRCRSFGEGGDGYVAGEGVGAVLLKSLDKAIEDGDHIYGVVKSSVINHGGKTNGYSVPNPNAQGELIKESLKKANIDPETFSYLETHGTGTALGDPIEITGLKKAFGESEIKEQSCSIGSVKSNIGHLESAAGIAAVTKVLLQLKHQELVPSLHSTHLNPNIDFNTSPFYVQQKLEPWASQDQYPRRAGISSFGAGGANAHVIIEEYIPVNSPSLEHHQETPQAFTLSAKNQKRLLEYAERMVDFLKKNEGLSLIEIIYTLQVGRTPMNERLAIICSGISELLEKLEKWVYTQKRKNTEEPGKIEEDEFEGVYQGNIKNASSDTSSLLEGEEGKAYLKVIMDSHNLEKLSKLWISGAEVDWSQLYQNQYPQRISLPTYPFARERYWIDKPVVTPNVNPSIKQDNDLSNITEEIKSKLYYSPIWVERTLKKIDPKSSNGRVVIILDTSEKLFLNLKEQERHLERDKYILVKPGEAFEEIKPSVYTINPQEEEHYQQLIEILSRKDQVPYRIVHQGEALEDQECGEIVTPTLNNGIYALFNLCKILMKQKKQSLCQVISIFSSMTKMSSPFNKALSGFFKTLTLENPYYQAKTIEILGGIENNQPSVAKKIEILENEFNDENWNDKEIQYSFKKEQQIYHRYTKELKELESIKNTKDQLPIKQNGVYIVSGGLGGLGLVFSEYLVKNYGCNLILFGRSTINEAKEEKLNKLRAYGTKILYLKADASKIEDMQTVVETAKAKFLQINGVLHSAGVNKDSFIIKKTKEEINQVLASKVYGTINLDIATKNEDLDIFIMFSSIAGVTGNIGQSDYAYGNHFQDSYAKIRANLVQENKRKGKTLSINWPYWEEGGMHISDEEVALIQKQSGLCPIPLTSGIEFMEEFLLSDVLQGIPLYGFASRIKKYMGQVTESTEENESFKVSKIGEDILLKKTETYLKDIIGTEIKLDPERIDSFENFESFGIDSIIISQINTSLEKDLGALSKTLFYEYSNIDELVLYLLKEKQETLIRFLNIESYENQLQNTNVDQENVIIKEVSLQENNVEFNGKVTQSITNKEPESIAIIGIHGHYPQSGDLNKYWENLKQGKDVTEFIPKDRWNYEDFYHEDPEKATEGKIYAKWGGFVADVDKFDPQFFNISQEEAKIMDPQERLFLQSVWATIEDAGYTRESLKRQHPKDKSANVGVFVGVTTNTYNLLASEEWSKGNAVPSAHPWSIANRVSYLFDFNGPSMPVDTACSSSSVAIHLACESLRKEECKLAVAGGVNLYLHPSKYHSLCKSRMISQAGKCHSYGAGGDGFIPGEGIGSILLKPLSEAIKDGDHIYATLKGSAYDHSGRSNGYSAPNPNAQANLIEQTFQKASISPETISYIEGHGTGTQLGDSLEIVALTNAFKKQTNQKLNIPIGSVKANIGHPESAAGIAGVAKVLLQMKHRQLVPTINSEDINPNINFEETPFYLQHQLAPWEPVSDYPRRALINSFGAGGVNACLLIEEYEKKNEQKEIQKKGPHLIVLSARNQEALKRYTNQLNDYLKEENQLNLTDLSFTLQVGREAMSERLAIIVSDKEDLKDKLENWNCEEENAQLYKGKVTIRQGRKNFGDKQKAHRDLFEKGRLNQLAYLWVTGEVIDWGDLYKNHTPLKISLPTYPFAKERHWVSDRVREDKKTESSLKKEQLHPLISYNSSTLKEIRFSSWLSDKEFYALDHQVNGTKIFPGSGFIEMANIAGSLAGEQKVCKIRDIVWAHPLSFENGTLCVQTSLKSIGEGTEFKITSIDYEGEPLLHSEGKLYFQNGGSFVNGIENIPIQKLKEQCSVNRNTEDYYAVFDKVGFTYGKTFRTIQEFYIGNSFAISKLKLSNCLIKDADHYVLHPSLIDGALQTVAGLMGQKEPSIPHLPFAIDEIEILRPLSHICYAYVEPSGVDEERLQTGIKKFTIKMLNDKGDVLVRIKDFYVRALNTSNVNQNRKAVDQLEEINA
ncbi:SDR family NAD(P)-dependent oxidoreductase [Aquimarina rhabdastrellae]